MPREISPATSLDSLKKEAKRLLRALRAGDPEARRRFQEAHHASPDGAGLRDVQHALAREFGCESWHVLSDLVAGVAAAAASSPPLLTADAYNNLARDWVRAYDERDEQALERLNAHYERSFSFDDLAAEIWRRVYAFRQRAGREQARYLRLEEAQLLLAQDTGYGSWQALLDATHTGTPPVPAYHVDREADRIAPRRRLRAQEWDALLGLARERRVSALDAGGLMTDAVLARLPELSHLTALALGGSREVTDEGLHHLARLPQLESLELNGLTISDRGLEVLRHLPNLRSFELTWHRTISDAGASHLRHCERLER